MKMVNIMNIMLLSFVQYLIAHFVITLAIDTVCFQTPVSRTQETSEY
jgi:hypothetical protein